MHITPFSIARLPRILFGEGRVADIPAQVAAFGKRVLIIIGAQSFRATAHWQTLQQGLREQGITWETFTVQGEPSPDGVDEAVRDYRKTGIEVVLGIGGGSVLDAAKAIAGLLPHGNSVMDHLEGVGKGIAYQGPSTPFIAVPTTAGTGSEATKNAVLSRQDAETGFKKSFRHECLVPQVAIVDPALLASCPPDLLAANGMDAFTQLLESYVSSNANPLTDALAISGMTAFRDGFFAAWEGKDGRSQLAYAALLSGITLAQTGLGSVHGLASPLGAFFPCPHGVVCGTLVAEATDINIAALSERAPNSIALSKYENIGALLVNRPQGEKTLVDILRNWTERLALPKLSAYGMQSADLDKVVANCRGGSMKTNPIVLTDGELRELLLRRL
ncbi:MAG: iron-containing alcohol dehydrogenase [Pseudomonadota bacterium]